MQSAAQRAWKGWVGWARVRTLCLELGEGLKVGAFLWSPCASWVRGFWQYTSGAPLRTKIMSKNELNKQEDADGGQGGPCVWNILLPFQELLDLCQEVDGVLGVVTVLAKRVGHSRGRSQSVYVEKCGKMEVWAEQWVHFETDYSHLKSFILAFQYFPGRLIPRRNGYKSRVGCFWKNPGFAVIKKWGIQSYWHVIFRTDGGLRMRSIAFSFFLSPWCSFSSVSSLSFQEHLTSFSLLFLPCHLLFFFLVKWSKDFYLKEPVLRTM